MFVCFFVFGWGMFSDSFEVFTADELIHWAMGPVAVVSLRSWLKCSWNYRACMYFIKQTVNCEGEMRNN